MKNLNALCMAIALVISVQHVRAGQQLQRMDYGWNEFCVPKPEVPLDKQEMAYDKYLDRWLKAHGNDAHDLNDRSGKYAFMPVSLKLALMQKWMFDIEKIWSHFFFASAKCNAVFHADSQDSEAVGDNDFDSHINSYIGPINPYDLNDDGDLLNQDITGFIGPDGKRYCEANKFCCKPPLYKPSWPFRPISGDRNWRDGWGAVGVTLQRMCSMLYVSTKATDPDNKECGSRIDCASASTPLEYARCTCLRVDDFDQRNINDWGGDGHDCSLIVCGTTEDCSDRKWTDKDVFLMASWVANQNINPDTGEGFCGSSYDYHHGGNYFVLDRAERHIIPKASVVKPYLGSKFNVAGRG